MYVIPVVLTIACVIATFALLSRPAALAELLDVAVAALAGVEHLTGHGGDALDLLGDKVIRVVRSAEESGS